MSVPPPLRELEIKTAEDGFYSGFNQFVSVLSKVLIGILIVWAAAFPDWAGSVLKDINRFLNANFGSWYMYILAVYVAACFALAFWPSTGRILLGRGGERPEFSYFSWISMMFGAGIGIGMLTYATAEPIYHLVRNPDVIKGLAEGGTEEAVRSAYRWSFMHWGLSAWCTYAITGLSFAFFSYTRGLPLTIRSGLTPLFGNKLSGPLGHLIDVSAVLATILGVSVTIGAGVSQFSSGLFNITEASWLFDAEGGPTMAGMILSLVIVMGASTLSAMSGVGRGIKWLSNINMSLSFFILAFFLIFGATMFSLKALFVGLWDYLLAFPTMIVTVWQDDGTETGAALAGWQGSWTIFYWAWWIAFAPFVGLFLARISRGRTLREYVLAVMIVPSLVCFSWFTFVGGTAISLELNGIAQGQIMNAPISAQLFETINVLLSPTLATVMSMIIVILLLTYLVTTADSAVLIINMITAAGKQDHHSKTHILVWGGALTLVIGVLLVAGGLSAINTAMIIGALPFSVVLGLMVLALFKAVIRDGMRQRASAPASSAEE